MLSKKCFSVFILICLVSSFVYSTIIEIEVMSLGNNSVILCKDNHRLDDSQEIWQSAALILSALDPFKPADLVLIEKNDICTLYNNLPDAGTSDTSSLDSHNTWVQNLKNCLLAKGQIDNDQFLRDFRTKVITAAPGHSNQLSLLDLFFDTYSQFGAMPVSVDHRQASVLIHSFTYDYHELFMEDIQQWNLERSLPDLVAVKDSLVSDLAHLPSIPLINLHHEQYVMHQMIDGLKSFFPGNAEFSQKLEDARAIQHQGRTNILKVFAYLHNIELLKNISEEVLKDRLKDPSLNQVEMAAISEMYNQSITQIVSDAIVHQTQHIFDQMQLEQTSERQSYISSFIKKRALLFVSLNFDTLSSAAQMVELESLTKIMQCISGQQGTPKRIMVIGGVQHMQELSDMLLLVGAGAVDPIGIDMESFDHEGLKTSNDAFALCDPVNQMLVELAS